MTPDRVAVLDWSAAGKPSPRRPGADAIWLGTAGPGGVQATYFRTRYAAEAALRDLIRDTLLRNESLLIGADFPFGYPAGFARALTGQDGALSIWAYLATLIRDSATNENNRFQVAQDLNARFPGLGPFWGRPAHLQLPGLPDRGTARDFRWDPPLRLCERAAPGVQEVWKLFTTGSVGSQALLGIPALHRLRLAFPGRVAVWPFQPPGQVTLAEVWPSLLAADVRARMGPGSIKDEVQVTVLATALHRLGKTGYLAALLTPPAPAATLAEEGWILGAGHVASLRAAL